MNIAHAATDMLLLPIVVGVVLLAVGVDVAAVVTWLQRRLSG